MPATYVGESHQEQDVYFIIHNIGGVSLTNGKQCHYVFGIRDCLLGYGYMNPTNTNKGSWKESARRKWCNEIFRNAIPEPIRSCFKQFKCITATEYNSNTVTTTDDYFALPAEKEILNRKNSTPDEASTLIQFASYATSSKIFMEIGGETREISYWTRSPYYNDSNKFCYISSGYNGTPSIGSSNIDSANRGYYITVFGCI